MNLYGQTQATIQKYAWKITHAPKLDFIVHCEELGVQMISHFLVDNHPIISGENNKEEEIRNKKKQKYINKMKEIIDQNAELRNIESIFPASFKFPVDDLNVARIKDDEEHDNNWFASFVINNQYIQIEVVDRFMRNCNAFVAAQEPINCGYGLACNMIDDEETNLSTLAQIVVDSPILFYGAMFYQFKLGLSCFCDEPLSDEPEINAKDLLIDGDIIENYKTWFIPVIINDNHYIVFLIFLRKGEIYIYDSMHDSNKKNKAGYDDMNPYAPYHRTIFRWIRWLQQDETWKGGDNNPFKKNEIIPLKEENLKLLLGWPQQGNKSDDCGAAICMLAWYLMQQIPIDYHAQDITKFRRFISCMLLPFPFIEIAPEMEVSNPPLQAIAINDEEEVLMTTS